MDPKQGERPAGRQEVSALPWVVRLVRPSRRIKSNRRPTRMQRRHPYSSPRKSPAWGKGVEVRSGPLGVTERQAMAKEDLAQTLGELLAVH